MLTINAEVDFSSLRFVQDMNEGNSERYTEYLIYPDSGYYTESGVDSVRASSSQPLDDTAFFYFVRTVPLVDGERYEFDRYFRRDRTLSHLDIFGDIDQHRSRPSGLGNIKRLAKTLSQFVRILDNHVMLCDRPGDPRRVRFLERIVTD